MTKWTAPDIASIRGDNSRPLQKIFGSLTEYLKDYQDTIDTASASSSQTFVRNGEATTLTIGTVVYLDAQQGNRATVKRAFNTSDATSAKTLGVVAENIPAHSDGLVTTLGYLEKVNTSGFTAGQTLYLSDIAGQFTAIKPYAPNHMVYVGVVVRANAGNGIIYVRCQNGYELDEIHDVLITSPTAGQTLSYDAVTSLWKNATFSDGGGLTNLNASNLASGTVPTGRMTGSYTGITGVGTLTGLTISGAGANRFITINAPTGYYAIQYFAINGTNKWHYELNPAGTRWSLVESGVAERIGVTNAGATFSGAVTIDGPNSPSFTLGDTGFATYSGITGDKGYLLVGNSIADTAIYLRSSGPGGVKLGASGSNTLLVGNGTVTVVGNMTVPNNSNSYFANENGANFWRPTDTSGNSYFRISSGGFYVDAANYYFRNASSGIIMTLASSGAVNITGTLTVNTEMYTTGGAGGYGFYDRSNSGEYFVWYASGADALLYSARLGTNILGFARTTGQMYVYNGVNGTPLYGSYGTFNIRGNSGGWYGIVFPDDATTFMASANGQYFGVYRNNSTWNFYVVNGTFVPSDERYKRDIEPLQHGMNFIREIVPVTFDPLTEDPSDDPEQTVGRTHYGFTTQNILQALTNAGETRDIAIVDIGGPANQSNESDRQYLNHSALIAPIVKAIQELDTRLQQLETL